MKKVKRNKKIILILLTLVILPIFVILLVNILTGKGIFKKKLSDEEILARSSIDINDEAYKNCKIYVENGSVVIENENGGKTIETVETQNKSTMQKVNEETKQKYEIKNIELVYTDNLTLVKGKVTNNDKKRKKIQIKIVFYDDKNQLVGSDKTTIDNIKLHETKSFEMKNILGNFSSYKYNIEVEYVK